METIGFELIVSYLDTGLGYKEIEFRVFVSCWKSPEFFEFLHVVVERAIVSVSECKGGYLLLDVFDLVIGEFALLVLLLDAENYLIEIALLLLFRRVSFFELFGIAKSLSKTIGKGVDG